MARCDEGYICAVCRLPVDTLPESLLYLRYLLGEVGIEVLHQHADCHIRCCPEVGQYILHRDFEPMVCAGPFAKSQFDEKFREDEEKRVTAAWTTLHEAAAKGFSLLSFIAK
ncbi:hypothetical protein KIH39_15080 [Telmatocola sphagniphila]|jgi:hypothetical protein|uniref:Uncharacterized protein n=1 Tax=Telmatocola sphagniphila TaxID=1123043 RepID=A0A8E6B1Q4_9BACT|nr:hypothetical protein [Telmatocola sphagniphila]QVL30177.1 hypothetical protein KIH39_15080 [Telmatocola sphagniphila]